MTRKEIRKKENHKYRTFLLWCLLLLSMTSFGQIRLFQEDRQQEIQWKALRSNRNVRIFNYDTAQYALLKQNRQAALNLLIPTLEGDLEAELFANKVLHDDFVLSTDKQRNLAYTPGLYYSGKIKGQDQSMVVISLFENEVMAMISRPGRSNQVIGRSPVLRRNSFVLFDEGQQEAPSFTCKSPELPNWSDGIKITKGSLRQQSAAGCIKVYFELGNSVYNDKGGTSGAADYITAIYNAVVTLYSRESISTSISEVKVWTSREPYGTAASDALQAFGNSIGSNFNGNLAHFVRTSSGSLSGIAWLDMICGSRPYAYSEITNSYSALPTYSWTVHVVTHEMGHNLGSPHTQACSWPGGPIDNCVESEGGCAPGPTPVNGGTIMSYCHLASGVGVNFNNGFGPQPGDLIRTRVIAANCLGACEGGVVTSSPDLRIQGLSLSPKNLVVTTDPVSISYNTNNNGSAAAGSSTSTSYLSTDDALSAGDAVINTSTVSGLQANASQQTSFSYLLPSGSKSGTYFIIVCADQGNTVSEFSEGNNCASASLTLTLKESPALLADLAPAILNALPPTVTTGQSLDVESRIYNLGASKAQEHSLEMVMSADNRFSANDLPLFKATISSLNPESSTQLTARVIVPASLEQARYYLILCSDPENVIVESNKTNNCISYALDVLAPKPDLVVQNGKVSSNSVPSGVTFDIGFTVANEGTTTSPGFWSAIHISKNNNVLDGSDLLLGEINFPEGLQAGANKNGQFTISNRISPGNYSILVCADSQNKISESNEVNNCKATSVTITAPIADLITEQILVPNSFYLEDSQEVRIVFRNTGSARANPSRGQLMLLRNQGSKVEQYPLKTLFIPELAADASITLVEKFAVTDKSWLGQSSVSACIDDDGRVTESNESNNCRESKLNVLEPLPDLKLNSKAAFPEVLVTGSLITLPFEVTNPGLRSAPVTFSGMYFSKKDMVLDSTSLTLLPDSLASVSPGDTLKVSKEVLIPGQLKPGTWYLTLCLDSRKEIKEVTENNNCKSFRMELRNPMADLSVDIFSPESDSLYTSLPFPVRAVISNKGEIPAENVVIELYSATGAVAGLAASFVVEKLVPGNSLDTTITLVIPDSLFGQKTDLSLHADPAGQIEEMDLENNLAVFSITPQRALPDLQAIALHTDDSILLSGYPSSVTFGLQNKGLLPTGSFQVICKYVLIPEEGKLSDTLPVFAILHQGLEVGESDTGTISFTPDQALPSGPYSLILQLDPGGEITESREDNNLQIQPFRLDQSLPDVTPLELSIAGELRRGESMHATVRIRNIGNWTMPALRDTVYLSVDSLASKDDFPVALASLPELLTGEVAVVNFDLDIPDQARSGNQYLLLTLNHNHLPIEKNKTNNSIFKKIIIPNRKADLYLRGLQLAQSTIAAGDTLRITDFMENIGETAAGQYQVIHSIKKSPRDNDPLVTFNAIPYSGLEPAGSTQLASMAVIPEQLKPDTYYLISCLDAIGEIDEIRKDNNCGQLLFTVLKKEQSTPLKNDRIFVTIKTFPNPVIHELQIQGTFIQFLSAIRLTIRNYAGREVYRRDLPPGNAVKERLDLSNLAAGVYYFDLASEKGSWKQPFIKL